MELGTWADWANVVGAGVVGGAVIWLTRRTNKLAEAANRTSETVAALELKRDTTEAASREDERRLLLVSLSYPIGTTLSALTALKKFFATPGVRENILQQEVRQIAAAQLQRGRFTIAEGVRGRMHCIDVLTAARILRTEAAIPTFLTALDGLGTQNAELRAFGMETMVQAVDRALADVEAVWVTCHAACQEAGLAVGPLPAQFQKDREAH